MTIISKLLKRWPFQSKKKVKKDRKEAVKSKVEKKTGTLSLIDIFDSKMKYEYIIDLLIQREMVSPASILWIDEGKGSKAVLVALLKYLHVQGYYKDNMKLTNNQIKDISWNTFGVKISIDHIKHTKSHDVIIDYIPHASTIDCK